jgi:hypothetical protein
MTTTAESALTAEVRALLAERRDLPPPEMHRRLADPDPRWQAAVGSVLLEEGTGIVALLWDRGYQPVDLLRAAEKDRAARSFVAVVLLEEARAYRDRPGADAEWVAQVDAGGASAWWRRDRPLLPQLAARARTSAVAVARDVLLQLAMLQMRTGFPSQPMLRPPPSQWSLATAQQDGSTSEKLLARVRALLDKAEATEFPEEAEALAGKAQELMTRHAIDASMLTGDRAGKQVVGRRIGIDDPYARQKVSLLTAVARANSCEVIYSPGLGACNLFGTSTDVELVELLHASLLLQATRAMLAAGTQRDAWGRATTRSFRTSFLAAYAGHIGQRLGEAKQAVEAEAEQEYGSALLPVLAAKVDAVRAHVGELFPKTRTMRATTVSDGRGWSAGMAAANAADLGGSKLSQPRALDR